MVEFVEFKGITRFLILKSMLGMYFVMKLSRLYVAEVIDKLVSRTKRAFFVARYFANAISSG